jgi:hypothetical protein
MTISTVNTLPNEMLWHIGSFLLCRELLRLSQASQSVWERRENIIYPLARDEQRRMGMQIVPLRLKLTLATVAEHWRQLAPIVARIVRNALGERPLVFYSGRFDLAIVLLEESTLAVQGDPTRMSIHVMKEKNIKKAVILARSILEDPAGTRNTTLRNLTQRIGMPFDEALAIALSIPTKVVRVNALLDLWWAKSTGQL